MSIGDTKKNDGELDFVEPIEAYSEDPKHLFCYHSSEYQQILISPHSTKINTIFLLFESQLRTGIVHFLS